MCYLNINALSIFYCMFYPIGKKKKTKKPKTKFRKAYLRETIISWHMISTILLVKVISDIVHNFKTLKTIKTTAENFIVISTVLNVFNPSK